MATLVLLLRAINLGPKNKVPMADLRALLEEEGFTDVRTLLNSGNVVLNSEEPVAKATAHAERALEERFGFAIPVMARTAAQIAKIVETAPQCEHVVFLDNGEIYLDLPDGVRNAKLPEEAKGGTMRTWNTVRKLHAVASET